MEPPSNAPFNLDSFIRQRAEQQRRPKKQEPTATTIESNTREEVVSPPSAPPSSTEQSTAPKPSSAKAAQEAGREGEETTEALNRASQQAQKQQQSGNEATAQLKQEAEDSQARLAAEAAQEAAQASLEAIEFAHQAARSAIEEASKGRKQKRTYNTHRLLVTLNITLLIAALVSLYLFWSPPPTESVETATTTDKTTEHLTQQLLLETQRERLRSEQELALMEQSLSRLLNDQKALREHLNETTSLLNHERERSHQERALSNTFNKMEQDLKQKIAELEKRLDQQPPPSPVPAAITTANVAPPKTAPAEPDNEDSKNREKEVDEILQKLYTLHSELSQQQPAVQQQDTNSNSASNQPYSYRRK